MKVPVSREHNYPCKIQNITSLLVISRDFTRFAILSGGLNIYVGNVEGCGGGGLF